MHQLNFDHGFSKACPGGNISAQIMPNPPRRGFCMASDEDEFCDDGEKHRYIDGNCVRCGKDR